MTNVKISTVISSTIQLIRYSRACNSYQDVLHRSVQLTSKLLNQSFVHKTCLFCYHHLTLVSQRPQWLKTYVCNIHVVRSVFHSLIRHRGYHNGCRMRSRKCSPFGAHDFTSGFQRRSCDLFLLISCDCIVFGF